MASKDDLKRLGNGVHTWNAWRGKSLKLRPDLSGANFSGMDLSDVDLENTDLGKTNFSKAKLRNVNFYEADLSQADFTDADLRGTSLARANLALANFSGANLTRSILSEAILTLTSFANVNFAHADLQIVLFLRNEVQGSNWSGAVLGDTVFGDLDLSQVLGLDKCRHRRASIVDPQTLRRSGSLPSSFLRGVGLPDELIDYLPSLLNQAIQRYSCFISYSARDQDFAERLHADLQNNGVRCWFAPHDMPIGAKILDEIDTAIRLREKVFLILSEYSIVSDWVEDEVTKAFEEERKRGQTVLFPIRVDDAVMETNEAWAAKLRARHIGDFRRWKDHDAYKAAFERVLRDLTVKQAGA